MFHMQLTGPTETITAAEDALADHGVIHVTVVDGDARFLVCEHEDRDHVRAIVADAGWTVRGAQVA